MQKNNFLILKKLKNTESVQLCFQVPRINCGKIIRRLIFLVIIQWLPFCIHIYLGL